MKYPNAPKFISLNTGEILLEYKWWKSFVYIITSDNIGKINSKIYFGLKENTSFLKIIAKSNKVVGKKQKGISPKWRKSDSDKISLRNILKKALSTQKNDKDIFIRNILSNCFWLFLFKKSNKKYNKNNRKKVSTIV